MGQTIWKSLTVILLIYIFSMGLLGDVPRLDVLNETIRNLYFHVPLWFAMILMLLVSCVISIIHLVKSGKASREELLKLDDRASSLAAVSVVFGLLGFATGMLWGQYTWGSLGSFLFQDPKTLGAMIGLLIYMAYFVLRGSMEDEMQAARISAVYSVFAYGLMFFFIFVFPRIPGVPSIHPGAGGNPGFSAYDLDNGMRMIFYPAVIAYFMLGLWIAQLRIRLSAIDRMLNDRADTEMLHS